MKRILAFFGFLRGRGKENRLQQKEYSFREVEDREPLTAEQKKYFQCCCREAALLVYNLGSGNPGC